MLGVNQRNFDWLEDRLSVLILRLLGHRWPKQLEAEEPVPAWASSDGIIPLVEGTGEATLAEQVRARLRAEDGELGVQQTEALLTDLTGVSLEEWLRRRFFSRHMSQFKYRPIAWHLASTPTNNGRRNVVGHNATRRLNASFTIMPALVMRWHAFARNMSSHCCVPNARRCKMPLSFRMRRPLCWQMNVSRS